MREKLIIELHVTHFYGQMSEKQVWMTPNLILGEKVIHYNFIGTKNGPKILQG